MVAEGAGACSVAAALGGKVEPARRVVCVVSGGGIDGEQLCQALKGKVPNPANKN